MGACATTSSTRPTWTALERAITDETRLIWVESPTNPRLDVIDIAAVLARRAARALVAVDNTFATPVNQRPLELGARLRRALHDQVPRRPLRRRRRRRGARDGEWYERLRFVQNAVGAVPGPFDCFLVHRGLRTLHLRMQAHARSAQAVVELLRDSAGRADVRWPGFSGMVSFRHPHARGIAIADAAVHARGVARRRRVADRASPGDDPPVGRGLEAAVAARSRPSVAASRSPRTWSPTYARRWSAPPRA